MENFKLSTVENVKNLVASAKAKLDAIAQSDANSFFDGDKLKTQTLSNLLMISAGASKNKYDAAKGDNKFEKLYNVLSGATSTEAQAVNNKLKELALKMQAKGKTADEIADLLDTTEDEIKTLLGLN